MQEEKNTIQTTKPKKNMTVKRLMTAYRKKLGLRLKYGRNRLERLITVVNLNRPGLAIAGHLELFRHERIQIIGQGELGYCRKANKEKLRENFDKMFENGKVPCVIISGGIKKPPEVLLEACQDNDVPLFISSLETSKLIQELTSILEEELTENISRHGVLVNVYGLGVLIEGEAGVGKTECALELIKRGHLFVADDCVKIKRSMRGWIIGEPYNQNLQTKMEVRGLGMIDIKDLFGISSIMEESYIEMSVYLEPVNPGEPWKYDRTGLNSETETIMGVKIPFLRLPVTPGRNLAVLIEVAALNQRLTNKNGISTSEAVEKRLIAARKAARKKAALEIKNTENRERGIENA